MLVCMGVAFVFLCVVVFIYGFAGEVGAGVLSADLSPLCKDCSAGWTLAWQGLFLDWKGFDAGRPSIGFCIEPLLGSKYDGVILVFVVVLACARHLSPPLFIDWISQWLVRSGWALGVFLVSPPFVCLGWMLNCEFSGLFCMVFRFGFRFKSRIRGYFNLCEICKFMNLWTGKKLIGFWWETKKRKDVENEVKMLACKLNIFSVVFV